MDSRSPIAFHSTCTHSQTLLSKGNKPPTPHRSPRFVHRQTSLRHPRPPPRPQLPRPRASAGPRWSLAQYQLLRHERTREVLGFPFPTSGGVPTEPTLRPGAAYQVVFETKEYFERTGGRKSFYPFVQVSTSTSSDAAPPLLWLDLTLPPKITFTVEDPTEHYHVPVLISPFSYTTYRGS